MFWLCKARHVMETAQPLSGISHLLFVTVRRGLTFTAFMGRGESDENRTSLPPLNTLREEKGEEVVAKTTETPA